MDKMEGETKKPIPGPSSVGPENLLGDRDLGRELTPALRVGRLLISLVKEPALWIRENIVEPNRGPKYYWYHRKYKRALPIDECYIDDVACIIEADDEFKRTLAVDRATLDLLRFRAESCTFWYSTSNESYRQEEKCRHLYDTLDKEKLNFMIKYGELRHNESVMHAYNKQKHRMIMERRRAQAEQTA